MPMDKNTLFWRAFLLSLAFVMVVTGGIFVVNINDFGPAVPHKLAAGSDALPDLRSDLPAAGALATLVPTAAAGLFRGTVDSCASSEGGNQKSQSLRTTATRATSSTPSAISIRLR